ELAASHGVGEIEIDSLNTGTADAVPLALADSDRRDFLEGLPAAVERAEQLGLRHNLRDFFSQDYIARAPQEVASVRAPAAGADPLMSAACLFPWFHATITSDGRLAPCCHGEQHEPEVTLHDVSFREAWLDRGMRAIRRAM